MRVLDIERRECVAILRLDRPSKRNSLTPNMLRSLAQALDNSISARAIVLSGVGEHFCAGFDLSLCRDDDSVLGELLSGLWSAAKAVRSAPCPVVVSAHGSVLAGGCALACAGDIIVTHGGAKLGYPVVRLGISPGVSLPWLAPAIGSAARVRELDCGLIDGAEAMRIGLAHECVPDADTPAESARACEDRAIELARMLADKPAAGMGYTKAWLNQLDGSQNQARLQAALEASLALVGSAEQRERLAELWKK